MPSKYPNLNIFRPVLPILEWVYSGHAKSPDFRPRDRPMEILALGISRSGTDSLKQALEELGYERVYHGFDIIAWPEENIFWREAMKAKFQGGKKFTRDDWDKIFGHCRAISDLPAILFAKELIEAYPEAKVILSTRDVESWYQSVATTVDAQVRRFPTKVVQLFHPLMIHFFVFYQIYEYFFRGDFENQGKVVYEEYNAMIRGLVPKENLLEYHVREGWEPLCKWLGKEVPKKEMPNGNMGADFEGRVERIQAEWKRETLRNMMWFFGTFFGITSVAGFCLWRRLSN